MVGNLKNYTKIDILRCLMRISKPVSRSELSKTLDLGEGTIRSILDILKENQLLVSNKKGHCLSKEGRNVVDKIKKEVIIKEVEISIFPGKKIAIQIKHHKNREKSYILRDIAVKNGADGATIIEYEKGKLKISDFESDENLGQFQSEFDLDDGDLVFIAYADSYRLAEHGALAVAVELNSELNHLIGKFK